MKLLTLISSNLLRTQCNFCRLMSFGKMFLKQNQLKTTFLMNTEIMQDWL